MKRRKHDGVVFLVRSGRKIDEVKKTRWCRVLSVKWQEDR